MVNGSQYSRVQEKLFKSFKVIQGEERERDGESREISLALSMPRERR